LETEAQRLAHADELGRLARELEQALGAAGLARAAKLFAGLLRLDPSVAPWQELLDGALANLEELGRAARDYAGTLDGDPDRLAGLEQRRDLLYRLTQKYGPALPDVLATRDQATRELELLDTAEWDLGQLAERRATAAADFARACAALGARRAEGAARLAATVNDLLPALGLPGGRFEAALPPLAAPRGDGAERVVFQVQLNIGLEPRALAKVASGGELSRLMLALKVVLAAHDAVPTLVFDEVDQGIGGEVGGRVGEALARVGAGAAGAAGRRQALVITHLPQIAAYAEHHLVVAKGARGRIATSDVQVVVGEARTRELARMLGDPDMRTALGHAAELLKRAAAPAAAPAGTPSRPGPARRR
jgi:DNA repair protein RecN (Recombination protein N)